MTTNNTPTANDVVSVIVADPAEYGSWSREITFTFRGVEYHGCLTYEEHEGYTWDEWDGNELPDDVDHWTICSELDDLTCEMYRRSEIALPDTIPGNLARLLELAELLSRENHPLAVELHGAYVDLRDGVEGLVK